MALVCGYGDVDVGKGLVAIGRTRTTTSLGPHRPWRRAPTGAQDPAVVNGRDAHLRGLAQPTQTGNGAVTTALVGQRREWDRVSGTSGGAPTSCSAIWGRQGMQVATRCLAEWQPATAGSSLQRFIDLPYYRFKV